MKKAFLLFLFFVGIGSSAFSQISVSCATGATPTLSTGWSLGGSAVVSGSAIQLTAPAGSQAGQLWYNTSLNVTACGAFTVDFDFQIIPSASAFAIADGLAFWFVNPLSGFIGGGGVGLPTNPNGLVLVLDTYDNDGVPNDPLLSLYGYPSGFTGTYVEGVTTNRLANMNNQNFIDDGGWHHVHITYSGGNIKVYFNYSGVPGMTGYFPITTAGYFGFTASTGGAWSTQSVRNIYVNSNTISPIVGPNVLCMSNPVTYTDATASGTWTSSNPSVVSIGASTGLATPVSAGTATLTYAYSSTCTTTLAVTVDATSLAAITGTSSICPGTPGTLADATAGGTWSSSNTTIGTIASSTGIANGLIGGTTTITYTLPVGCYTTRPLTVNTAPAPINITPSPATVCDNGSLTLTAAFATANNLFPAEGWENGVPTTAGFQVDMWSYIGATSSFWYQQGGALTTAPATAGAYSGSFVADFNCRSLPSGSTAALCSPAFSMTGVSSGTLSFWVYRDVSAYNTAAYNTEGLTLYANTSPSLTGATNLGFVPRRGGAAITGTITGASTVGTSGWQQYTAPIPASFTGGTNYILISGFSQNGDNIYLDSVTVTGAIAPPVWTPATYLFNDAGFTSTYVAAPLNPVYMHPTGVSAITTITYSVSATNGTCSSSGTNTVTINPNPVAITGTAIVCLTSTTTLADATPGGSWTSSNPAIATVGSSTGTVSGITTGTATITYSVGSCYTTIVATVVASPTAISGVLIACLGSTTTLANGVAGGSWSSSNLSVGSIGSSTGIVAGLTLGTTTVVYGFGTCIATAVVTVNPYPTPITGVTSLCIGTSSPLASTPTPGIWTSSTPSIATVGVTTGIVNGIAIGTSTISYRVAGCTTTTTVSVFNTIVSPPPIAPICVGSTGTATPPIPGGTWSCTCPTIATIGSSTGIITGIGAGTCTITYGFSAGCYSTRTITVNATPTTIGGTLVVCVGATTTLTHPTAGGTWSTASPNASIVLGTGVTTGLNAGTAEITYTLPGGCTTTTTVTIYPLPSAITGTMIFCQGGGSTLSSTPTGGTWSNSCPTIASVDPSSGAVSGLGAGTCTISYTSLSGCSISADVTVTALPSSIGGSLTVCAGGTSLLTSSPAGGAWSSSTPTVGTISGTGLLAGLIPGTTTIAYALASGCQVTAVAVINPSPATISGSTGLCVGFTTSLSTTSPGGTWTSSNPLVATVSSSGLVSGLLAGTSVISYTLAGCSSTVIVSVNSLPGPITGTMFVCVGSSTPLTSSTGGGTWSSSNPSAGTVDGVGNVTGISGLNTTIITYSLGSGCSVTALVTINPLPGTITGNLTVCIGATSTLTSSPGGGTWISSTPGIAGIGVGSGILTGAAAGTSTITYTVSPSGCATSTVVTVNALPTPISGVPFVCAGSTTNLGSTPVGGTWTSSNLATGTIGLSTGVFYGVASGTTTVSYTAPVTGCKTSLVVLVNIVPTITGPGTVCQAATNNLTSTPGGGIWSSSNTSVATVVGSGGGPGFSTGVLTGVSAVPPPGTATISYTLSTTSCFTSTIVTVNPLPATITGTASLCVGLTTNLSTTTPGCTWSSSNLPVATIGSSSGIVTGVAAGNATITCKNPTTSCQRTIVATVNALPGAITGIPIVCVNSTTTLSCTPASGTWTSLNPAIASVGASTGVVTGFFAGTTIITYTVGSGCIQTITVTVNPLPGTITGILSFSEGSTTNLSCLPTGGAWSSGNLAVGTVNSSTGVVYSPACGTANITYTLPTGCRSTITVTSNCLPGVITGAFNVCVTSTTSLHCSPTGGTWSTSTPAVGTIDPSTGILTGITAGTTRVTYTLPTLTQQYAIITVNPLPSSISGTVTLCQGSTTTLTSGPTGGTWSSSNTAVATVPTTSGLVSGLAAGSTTISYTLPTGCAATQVVVINALPAPITGTLTVCQGLSTTLSSATPGGVTWSTGSANASVGIATGIVTGISGGTAVITCYTSLGCTGNTTVTVNPLPASITGILKVCVGFTTTVNTTTTGGVWSSSNPAVGTISPLGEVAGLANGTTVITYTLPATGCINTAVFTVNPNPATITGSSGFCNFTSSLMSTTTPGITWGSLDPGVLTIDPSTGIATGVTVGTGTITCATSAGCTASKTITIIIAPYIITGPTSACIGSCVPLGNIITGGTWTSSDPTIAPVDISTGIACGVTGGTATITYALSLSGCYSTHDVTVNAPPSGIAGALGACEGATTNLSSSTSGGSWSSSNATVGTIDATTGVVTAIASGTTTISYILPTGCYSTANVTVNPLPAPIVGSLNICEGSTVPFTSTTSGGIWSSSSAGTVYVSSMGMVTGTNVGTAAISYALGTGCALSVIVTVNPLPAAITGLQSVCQNDSVTLNDISTGGAWISSNPVNASITSTGVVTGNAPGTAIISYMLPTSCASTIVFTVNTVPANITGSLVVCSGFASNLTDATTGGVWTSDPFAASVGTVHHITGVFTGITPGTVNITYTLGTGCKTTATGTVIVLPAAISGSPYVCVGQTTTLTNSNPGGSWSSSNPGRATVDATSGAVTGISAGIATITYMVGTGCFNVLNITVNPLPSAIAGPSQVCENSTITLTVTPTPGIWTSSHTSVATVGYLSGVVTGISGLPPGTTLITYTLPTGCISTKTITVNPTPSAITGSNYICQGSTVLMGNTMPFGVWSSSNPAVATIDPTGLVTPVTLGTSIISYTMPTGCQATKMVTVSPLPVVYNVTGGGTYCAGGNGKLVSLDGSQAGVSYVLYYGSSATGYHTGIGLPFDFGLETMAGVYTVQATYALSGCQRDMAGSVAVNITPLTPLSVGINTGGGDSTCPGTIVNLTPVTPGTLTTSSYIWSVNGVSVSTANNYSYVPANGDIVGVTMTGTGNCLSGTAATATKTLTVLPTALPVVNVLVTPGDTICQFSMATFMAAPIYGGSAPAYVWAVNGVNVGGGAAYSYVPVDGDVVSVQLTSNYMCRTTNTVTSSGVTMTVDSIRAPHVTIVSDSGLNITSGHPVTLHTIVTNAGPTPSYQWILNGYPIAGATNDSYTGTYRDYDSVTCKVTASGVCANIATFDWVFISIIPEGVQQVGGKISDIRLVPNPNNGLFTLKGSLGTNIDEELTIEITDMLGQIVYNEKLTARKGRIDEQVNMGNTPANGMYLLNLHSASEHIIFHFVLEQ